MKYLFNNVEFEPDSKRPIRIKGKVQPVKGQIPVKVLQFLLDNNKTTIDRDDIIAAVWGPEYVKKTTHQTLSTACSRANEALAGAAKIEYIRGYGYRIEVELEIKKRPAIQAIISQQKIPINKYTAVFSVLSFIFLSVSIWAMVKQQSVPKPTPNHTVTATEEVFMGVSAVTRPLLAPAGKYIAHRLAESVFADGDLAVTELAGAKVQKLAKIRYNDGLRWHMTGDKIVYQTKVDNKCEIRLIHLKLDKSKKDDELLATCPLTSEELSFAWFSDNSFYFNSVDGEAPGLPLHQLYQFDIDTKIQTKVLSTDREGGVGFYSLEYDFTTKALYMLKINQSFTTDVYRYKDGKLTKVANVGQLLRFYTVFNNQFIYVNNRNELVTSDLNQNLATDKVLLPSIKIPVSMPNVMANKLTFLSGHLYNYALHQLDNDRFEKVELAGFIPYIVASYNGSLIFTSQQTGINQIYLAMADGEVKQLSDFEKDELILHISIVDDLVAVSHLNRVDFYQIKQAQLLWLNSLKGYTNAVFSKNGNTILAHKIMAKRPIEHIVELNVSDLTPTGLDLERAIVAFYRDNSQLVYIDNQQQLFQIQDGKKQKLTNDIAITYFDQAAIADDKLYYITNDDHELMVYDFATHAKRRVELNEQRPLRITAVDDKLYIRTQQAIAPKLMVGELVVNE